MLLPPLPLPKKESTGRELKRTFFLCQGTGKWPHPGRRRGWSRRPAPRTDPKSGRVSATWSTSPSDVRGQRWRPTSEVTASGGSWKGLPKVLRLLDVSRSDVSVESKRPQKSVEIMQGCLVSSEKGKVEKGKVSLLTQKSHPRSATAVTPDSDHSSKELQTDRPSVGQRIVNRLDHRTTSRDGAK